MNLSVHKTDATITKLIRWIAAITICLSIGIAESRTVQEPLHRKITLSLKNVSLQTAITEIQDIAKIKFVYSSSRFKLNEIVSIEATDKTLDEVLKQLFPSHGIGYEVGAEKDIIILFPLKDSSIKDNKQSKEINESDLMSISGSVTDSGTQQPLAGVNVIVKGTSNGTSTNADGEYRIEADGNDVLVFSFIGYKTTEANIGARAMIDIILNEDITSFTTVIVNAGYWNVAEKEKTGSISKVTSDVIKKQPVTNPLGALQGRMAGVYITQTTGVPGGDFKIQIRGRNSLRADGNEPLYIVDGVPFSMEKTFSGAGSTAVFNLTSSESSGASPLAAINPSDIESIEVLKDADATAIYGSRGANGVVLITTKKGKAGKTKFDLNVYSGVGKAPLIKLLRTPQYLSQRRQAFANDGITPNATPNTLGYSPELMVWDTTRYTDWQKVLIGGSAQTTSVQSSISGGSENTQFLFNLGYRNENSVYPGNFGYQQGSFHLTASHLSADKRFSINSSVIGSRDNNDQVNSTLVSNSRILAPNAPALYDQDGKLNWANSTWTNPLAELQNTYESVVTSFTGNTSIGYEIVKGLRVKSSMGINYFQSGETTKYPSTRLDPAFGYTSSQSVVTLAAGTNQSWIIEPQVSYERKVYHGKLTALVGSTFQEQKLNRKADNYMGFPSDALLDNVASATNTFNYELVKTLYRYGAVFGRLNYNWDGRYIVNMTARRDGSSRFGPGRQFANFGAVGAAWIFSNESFVKNSQSIISFGKLRASYGITGSDQIGNYQYLDTYQTNTSSSISSQYQGVTWLSPTKLFNPNYAWEVNKKMEAALELDLLNERLSLEVNYFKNRSSSQLVNYTLPSTTGFSGILSNLPATVQNTGWEVMLTTNNIRPSSKLQWTSSVNITIPQNKLLAFPNLESSTYNNFYVVGKPLSITKVLQSTGVNTETGLWTFKDVNGDGVISRPGDDTKVMFIGQHYYGGLANSFTFKGLTLDFLFQFVNQSGYNFWWTSVGLPGSRLNSLAFLSQKTIWTKPGDNAEMQKLVTENNSEGMQALQNFRRSDSSISNASFIRLKNVSLSWQLPARWTKALMCRLYCQGQNLWTITNYEGGDPEYQYQFLPPLRMITVGAQVTL